MLRSSSFLLLLLLSFAGCISRPPVTNAPQLPPMDAYISTGDNHWLGASLAVDSPQSIADSFDMLRYGLGVRRIYWRGLQEAMTMRTYEVREENVRYATFYPWGRYLIDELRIEPLAVKLAHERGMELWGIGNIADWGSSADTGGYNDYPFAGESRLRLEHPEWVPVDKYGYRRQGGVIELAYPEARQALVDLHVELATEAGYDGIMFLSYVESFSQRFVDEFGYSMPIVEAFKQRYGIDIRYEPFNKFASREDWHKLRGEYLTAFLQELKAALAPHGIQLGMFINPRDPHQANNWATLPQAYPTMGNVYFDVETWIRDGLVDQLVVNGASDRRTQLRTVDDLLWMSRGLELEVDFSTSSPADPVWEELYGRGRHAMFSIGHDQHYFLRGGWPLQSEAVLRNGTAWQKMAFLSQVLDGQVETTSDAVQPFVEPGHNIVLRRLALQVLGKLGDPDTVPVLEAALRDPENGIRTMAVYALGYNNGPTTFAALIDALDRHGNHPLYEMARVSLPRLRPQPREDMLTTLDHENPHIRTLLLRIFALVGVQPAEIPGIAAHLDDLHHPARFASAKALGRARNQVEAVHHLVHTVQEGVPMAANRACTSLAELLRQSSAFDETLRRTIVTTLTDRFRRFGDGYEGSDKSWGYRSVGDALLMCGQPGREALQAFHQQTRDQQLAELAWRVLYLRPHEPGINRFTIITEEANDAAFEARPDWLKTLRIPHLSQDFEPPVYIPGAVSGYTGTGSTTSGRWGPFTPKGPFIEPTPAGQVVNVVRGGSALHGLVSTGTPSGKPYELTFRLNQRGGAIALFAQNRYGERHTGLSIDSRGVLSILRDGGWAQTELVMPEDGWADIALRVDPVAASATVTLNGQTAEVAGTIAAWTEAVSQVAIFPQPPEGSSCLIDQIRLVEIR